MADTRHRRRIGRRARTASAAVVAAGFVGLGAPASAQSPSNGPLTYEEGSPLYRLSYTAMMEGADVAERGSLVTDVWLGFSNIFEQDSADTHVLFLDMERLVSSVAVRWGATDRLEVGARVQLESTGPGALDGVILDWHEAWGFGQANRDRFPEGQYAQRLEDGSGTVLMDVPSQAFGLEDVRIFGKYLLGTSADGRSAWSARGVLRIPTGSHPAGAERADVAASLLGRLALGDRWYGHGMLGASTVRASEALEPVLRNASGFLTLALERAFRSFSLVVQYQVQTPVLESFDHRELDREAANIVLGASGRIGTSWRWDASFQEDLPADTPAIDFTLGFRLSRTW